MTYDDIGDLEWPWQRSSIIYFEVLTCFWKIHYIKSLNKDRIMKFGIYIALSNVNKFAVTVWP
jgi:hypothetical protein